MKVCAEVGEGVGMKLRVDLNLCSLTPDDSAGARDGLAVDVPPLAKEQGASAEPRKVLLPMPPTQDPLRQAEALPALQEDRARGLQSKLKCDKLRPCGTCLRRAKAEECREPFTRSNPSSSSPELSYPATPESPWPLQLAVQLQSDRAAGLTDPTLGNLQLLAVRMSQAGYSGTSILYMFNSMGRELFDVLNDVMGFLLKLQPRQASPSPHPRNTSFEHDRSGQASAILMEGRQAAGSWTVFWEEDYLMRRGIEVGQGLGRLLHRNPEEILSRAARCEFEIPSSDLEFICMIVDDLLRLSSPRIVRYQRICRRSVDGRLEESSLVRVTSVKHFEEERLKSTCHTMEILDADEWSRIHEDKSNW
eukprot:381161-Hanusia_phi.AAC.2